MMKSHPILFSRPMVRAILDGTKTQTRRIIKMPKDFDGSIIYSNGQLGVKYSSNKMGGCVERLPAKWEIGDTMWVKETHAARLDGTYTYAADYRKGLKPDYTATGRWIPSLFMPREASRITLEVTDIRAEPLWHISNEDAIAEGIEPASASGYYYDYEENAFTAPDPKESYITLWDSINGPDAFEQNPWVWVINFKKI